MHKLIKKYQTPWAGGITKDINSTNNWLSKSFSPSSSFVNSQKTARSLGIFPKINTNLDFNQNYGINGASITEDIGSIEPPASSTATGTTLDGKKNWLSKGDLLGAVSTAASMVDPVLQSFGVKKADNISGGEQIFDSISQIGLDPKLLAATGGLSAIPAALSLVNNFAGKENKKQGTVGMDTGAYAFNLNPDAGKKQTLLGTWGGKADKSNKLTSYYDKMNLSAGASAYSNKQNLLSATNSAQDIATKNRQSIMGGLNTNILAAKKGTKLNPSELRNLTKKAKRGGKIEVIKFQEGGKIMNVIPEGALHARKHSLPDEISKNVTDKGIPVITYDEGGEIKQHAEIELNEIIFNKETTVTLEDYFKQYNEVESQEEKNRIAIECGKFLTSEILENTDDRTGLLNTIE